MNEESEPRHMPISMPFRIVIEGYIPLQFLSSLIDGIRDLTPPDGGFTLSVGTHTNFNVGPEDGES